MARKVLESWDTDCVEMRSVFCKTLIELAETDPSILVLDADLMGAIGTRPFAARFPEKTINCGIQEANMVGVAAGLSAAGMTPILHTFGAFAARRACDQVFMSCAYAKLNVKIIGSDPGITAALNGGTHMPFEDMGIMRCIPGITVLEPTDNVMLADILKQITSIYGVQYMRLTRKTTARVYRDGSKFQIGKAELLRPGKDVTIIASGYCVAQALKAAENLAAQGIDVRVLDMFTWKPADREAILSAARETGAIVTAENHSVVSGLGAAVSEVLDKEQPVPLERIGIQDEFGEVGPVGYLADRFHISAPDIEAAARRAFQRKGA